ncbi:transposable element Tcb2 transposase [Trichonephila clavipes]|nr:transposable element Tcb2 transposase [Trichonephila clavipes]
MSNVDNNRGNWRNSEVVRRPNNGSKIIGVITAQGAKCKNIGVVELNIRIREFEKPWLFHVLADLEYPYILGIDFIGGSKIILDFDQKSLAIPDSQIDKVVKTVEVEKVERDISKKKLEVKQKKELQDLFDSIQGLFSDKPGLTHVLYHEIDTGDKPSVVSWPYMYDRVKQVILDYHLDKMLKEGTIIPIQSPYVSPVVLCRKNNGLPSDNPETYRFAVDYRKLNAITKYPRYSLPLIDDLIMNIPHKGIMSALNLRSGYFQDEAEKLAYQLNEEAERTERQIKRLSKVMYGSTCADMQEDVLGECLSNIKHVVGLDAFTRGRIIGKLEEGRSVTSVAAEFGIAHSIVSRLWRQFQTTGTAIRGFSSGRPRGTTPADDRYIVLQARRNRRQTAGEIARHTTQATGRPISCFTVARRLHGGGLFARRPYDESRSSLSSDSYRILIWRERGSRNHPSNIIERDRGAMGLQFLFMDDNAPCHRTVAAEQLLESRRLAARTLPPVTIRELRLALQDEWAAMPQQLIDTLILSMGRRCETCLAVRETISPTKDQMFLAGHPSQGCFGLQSHCAPCYFFNQASFIPLISLLVSVAYITHVLTYWGSYDIKCVD